MGSRVVRLLSIAGTRPEAINLAPLSLRASKRPALHHHLCATSQHIALFDEALADFGVTADLRLAPPLHDPSTDVMVARFAEALAPAILAERPDMVIVRGDTNSVLAGAVAAHRLGIPIAHVEAGLRPQDMAHPWPEERNRVEIDAMATLLFAPTEDAAANLLRKPLVHGAVTVTGNTGIDALLTMCATLPALLPR